MPPLTSGLITPETKHKFNQVQIYLAGSLHQKSRDLGQKSKEQHFEWIEEETNPTSPGKQKTKYEQYNIFINE